MVSRLHRDVWLRVSGLNVCRASYSPTHHPMFLAQKILEDPEHVLYLPTKQKYNTRPRDTLWWNFSCNHLKNKAVVRSWAARRMKKAFVEALYSMGFNEDGQVRVEEAQKVSKGSSGLKGTLQMKGQHGAVTTTTEDVRQQMRLLVQALIERRKTVVKNTAG